MVYAWFMHAGRMRAGYTGRGPYPAQVPRARRARGNPQKYPKIEKRISLNRVQIVTKKNFSKIKKDPSTGSDALYICYSRVYVTLFIVYCNIYCNT